MRAQHCSFALQLPPFHLGKPLENTRSVVPIMKAIELKHLCAFVCKHNGSLHVASSGSLIKIETTQSQYHRPHISLETLLLCASISNLRLKQLPNIQNHQARYASCLLCGISKKAQFFCGEGNFCTCLPHSFARQILKEWLLWLRN